VFGSGLINGLRITMRHVLGRPVTELYPFEHKNPPANSRTFIAMHANEDGAPACKACNTCIVGCPDHALRLVKDPDDSKRALEFVVNSGRCTFCGLCVENCPFDSLYFTQDYERATRDKADLIYHLIDEGECTHQGVLPGADMPAHPRVSTSDGEGDKG
jgi:NADH-quinone oxidoreductase subunit I